MPGRSATLHTTLSILCAALSLAPASAQTERGWVLPYIGPMRGQATVSVGAQAWDNYLHVRNLIVRSTLDLAPGVRAHMGLRRREGMWTAAPLHPDIDEAYIEGTAVNVQSTTTASINLKIGRNRYLRFPQPDHIAYFDQVPGIEDLDAAVVTDYRGATLSAEIDHRSGLGAHFTGVWWGFDAPRSGANAIEAYCFLRRPIGRGLHGEVRLGALANRAAPLGKPAHQGYNALLSKQIGEFEVGALYENRAGSRPYTGVMVRFRPSAVTRALGSVGFDYARSPQGIAVQYDVYRWRINERTKPEQGDELVGEVSAVRTRTYWEQSFQRNEYEHNLTRWGTAAGDGVYAVVKEQPWRLDTEALVSPHTSISREWFSDRQGPAHLMQDVTYQFYRAKPHSR